MPPEKVGGYLRGPAEAVSEVWIRSLALWAPGPGMHPLPGGIRPAQQAGPGGLRAFMDEARPGGRLRRVAFRRTWGRTGESGIAAEDVRRGDCAGVPRVQGDLGPGGDDESGQGSRRVPDHRQPADRDEVQPAGAEDTLSLPGGRRIVRTRHAALRGSREVPARSRRHHVSQLHGDARRGALHTGTEPAAVRDARGRSAARRLEKRGGPRRTGSLPGLQRVQVRLPGERGYGHVQGGVSLALLSRAGSGRGTRIRWG